MKNVLTAIFTVIVVCNIFADDMIDPDLPIIAKRDNKKEMKESVPAFYHNAWAEGVLRRWHDVPTDSLEPLPKEKCDEMSDKYIAKCRAFAEERPHGVEAWSKLGDALLYRERWAEAEQAYEKAVTNSRLRDYQYARAKYGHAEALLGAGKTNECIKVLQSLVDARIRTHGKTIYNFSAWARYAIIYLTGSSADALGLPHYTGFKAFPEAQKADYTETFTRCPEITINLSGVDKKDARIEYVLEKKLKSRGFKYNFGKKGAYTLSISLDPSARVTQAEGYSLDANGEGTKIAARDKQGILWGIVSFIQILDPQSKQMRNCRIEDWPNTKLRGYLGSFWPHCTEYTIFNKMNSVTHQGHVLTNGRYTPLNMMMAGAMAREFKTLGLDLYLGFLTYTMNMGWPYCWNSYLGMQIEAGKKIAALGANIYYPNDDSRYAVVTKEDEATGLKPSDYDAKHLLKWYTAIKKDYPDFKFQYCPPFYWGPTAKHPYPDSREKYLRSLRILPPEVLICWTGERVCSFKKRQWAVKWYADLIGRKPILFQNKTGPHFRLSYIVDKTDWNGWHYPGFFEEDVIGYQKNSHTPMECPQITSLADCLWNVKAYDMERGIKRGLDQYVGKGLYEALNPALGSLSYFDKYMYGKVDTLVRDEDPKEVLGHLEKVRQATKNATEIVGSAKMHEMGAWMRAVGWAEGVYRAVCNPPDFRSQFSVWLKQTEDAALSSGYEKKEGDILFDAIDFHLVSAALYPQPEHDTGRTIGSRLAAYISPGRTAVAKANVKFLPLKGKCKLNIYAQGGCPKMKIVLNDKVVYEGRNPCNNGWDGPYSKHQWEFPSSYIVKGENVLKITAIGEDWFPIRINYAAILMPKVKKTFEDEMRPKNELDELTLDE